MTLNIFLVYSVEWREKGPIAWTDSPPDNINIIVYVWSKGYKDSWITVGICYSSKKASYTASKVSDIQQKMLSLAFVGHLVDTSRQAACILCMLNYA